MKKIQLFTIAAALSAASLAGCSGSESESAPVEQGEGSTTPSAIEDLTPAPIPAEPVSPAPVEEAPAATNSAAEVPPEEAPPPDEQMMDDAAATGMTARATRDGAAGTETLPTEEVERR